MLEQVENPADVRVRDLSSKLNFASESLVDPFVRRDLGANRLQCDLFLEFQIFRLVQLTHAASGNEADNTKSTRDEIAVLKRRVD